MKRSTILFIISFIIFFNFTFLKSQTIFNDSFEKGSKWSGDKSKYSLDNKNVKEGSSSLFIEHPNYQQSSILSNNIELKVGNLYKLSGFIKTESALTEEHQQYPTPLPACLSMESFPFTMNSTAVGNTKDWTKVEVVFIATKKEDKVSLNFGYNGPAKGKVWFDDIKVEEVDDITQYIPEETIKWYGKAFRFEDKGWIFLHIEGEPYNRGLQYGYLASSEIKEYITKYGTKKNLSNPQQGWSDYRFAADGMFLRKYDEEYLTEMKGIADGFNKAGLKVFDRNLDLVDVVTLNSAIDIEYSIDALTITPTPLTGKSFLSAEDELALQDRLHKCSSFLANNKATKDDRIVFMQMFMWNGYMGPHWNFIVDVVPTKGNRLVYETFPGGIHSGADFYINSKGIMIGETTVNQTPFNPNGIPQSNRIRKAAQYANSIDDVVSILTKDNNGLYTNDWLIGDTKTDEVAILNLGTYKYKVWRSGNNDWYGDQKDWYWSDNNNKSMDVRKEYVVNESNAPYDLLFKPVNRDIAFTQYYKDNYSKIDAISAINLINSSPINRPHACDGKVTTSEMAEQMMFFANYGKVTMREMFVNENGRIPDMPGAIPKFSLGYTVISPILFTERIKKLKQRNELEEKELSRQTEEVKNIFNFDKAELWHNTVYPASDKENWFVSSTAAYWNMLNANPGGAKGLTFIQNELSELNARLNYLNLKEGNVVPENTKVAYDQHKFYQIPRIRGTYFLHQVRLKIGNDAFSKAMNKIHTDFNAKDVTNKDILNAFNNASDTNINYLYEQWIKSDEIPNVKFSADYTNDKLNVNVKQNKLFKFITNLDIYTNKKIITKKLDVNSDNQNFTFELKEKPVKVIFNSENNIPLNREDYFTFSNFSDDFSNTIITYGTKNQVEANHTIALRFQKMAGDKFTEILLPVKKDAEVSIEEFKNKDIIILSTSTDNSLLELIQKEGLIIGKNYFEWNGKKYNNNDDGFFAAIPNPLNPEKAIYIYVSNSALELFNMTKNLNRIPSWGIFKKDQLVDKGYNLPAGTTIIF
ncbi:MAG TPA: C45 family autoproteolytic acyltransferase/hydrolase [Ignavibacteriaceae bacterium]|nr:C45 family autoproteolytic acyltransferase/hydrolase [Ignavibacteriaceae bacterium]